MTKWDVDQVYGVMSMTKRDLHPVYGGFVNDKILAVGTGCESSLTKVFLQGEPSELWF